MLIILYLLNLILPPFLYKFLDKLVELLELNCLNKLVAAIRFLLN